MKCEKCSKPVYSKSLCRSHYNANYRKTRKRKQCKVSGCPKPVDSYGMCSMHRRRTQMGTPLTAPERYSVHPGAWRVSNGYVFRQDRMSDGSYVKIYQHREVMERIIGRPLTPEESVHHKNGDRSDNRPENLELWSRYQPSGQRVEDKISYALEILRRYSPDSLAS